MNRKENIDPLAAAQACLKRKHILREKNNGRNRRNCGSSQNTPLSEITRSSSNQMHNNSVVSNFSFTQPRSFSNHTSNRKRFRFGIQSVAENLISRFNGKNLSPASANSSTNPTSALSELSYGESSCSRSNNPSEQMVSNNSQSSTFFAIPDGEDMNSDGSSSSDDELITENTQNHQSPNVYEDYFDIGDPIHECQYCQDQMWYQERMRKHRDSVNPKYHLCCGYGKVQLPLLKESPALLHHLLYDQNSPDSHNFQQNIRLYNMMFAFTSPGVKLDRSINNGTGPPCIRLQGQSCHRIGSFLPMKGAQPKFAQLYIYDTDYEVENRINSMRNQPNAHLDIVAKLSTMLDEFNMHARWFRKAQDRLSKHPLENWKLRLIFDRSKDGRIYNIPVKEKTHKKGG